MSVRRPDPDAGVPAMRVTLIVRQVTMARAPILLVLSILCACGFYLIVPVASRIDAFASLSASVVLWALAMGAACHAVLWPRAPTLSESLSASARAIFYTSVLVFVILLALFVGFVFLVILGLIALVLLSLSVPIMMRERPRLFAALTSSVILTVRYWGTALIVVVIGAGVMIVTTIGALLIAGLVMQGDATTSPAFDALMFGTWAVASGVLGSSHLLAIREVDAGG